MLRQFVFVLELLIVSQNFARSINIDAWCTRNVFCNFINPFFTCLGDILRSKLCIYQIPAEMVMTNFPLLYVDRRIGVRITGALILFDGLFSSVVYYNTLIFQFFV